ncbi:MAG: DUF2281 domain-containing protein [Crocosphaera sp.]|nr:DUF2281 domain-containing protein [Crocosphaera sp.]
MMIIVTGTCQNGEIKLDQTLPHELEGKPIRLVVEEVSSSPKKRRQSGSAKGKIWMSPDFDEPLEDFEEYRS